MGHWTLREVRDGSRDSWGGPRRVGGPSWRYRTGRETLAEVRDGLERCETGRGNLGEVWDGSRVLREGPGRVAGPSGKFGDSREDPEWVGRPSGRFETA